ncbi:MAG: antibiotic biosynthesis monooxygenase family protein [Hyphomicrobiaceae bacterium]
MPEGFANTPAPPYYAVIFSSKRNSADPEGYAAMGAHMMRAALAHPGCLGAESLRGADGFGITVAYYKDEASIAAWKADMRHTNAQKLGIERWYEHYELRVAKVERAYSGPEGRS